MHPDDFHWANLNKGRAVVTFDAYLLPNGRLYRFAFLDLIRPKFVFMGGILKTIFFLAVSFLAAAVAGAAQYDRELAPYMRGSADPKIMRVILSFKSSQDISRIRSARINSPAERLQVQRQLMAVSNESQREFVAELQDWKRQGIRHQAYSLWLMNAMILDMPASHLSKLLNVQSIDRVYADSTLKLIKPVEGYAVARQRLAEPTYTYGLQKIMVPQFRQAQPGILGKGVRVAVIDTGIDVTHPDLQNKVVAFLDLINKKTTAYDDQGHGTHCAGTIGGSATSGVAIGIAPEVSFMGAKFLDRNGSGTLANALLAMQWVVDPDSNPSTNDGAMVVSNSWGGGAPSVNEDPANNALCRALDAWVKLGAMPVFAAGNSGPRAQSMGLPGACPSAFSIGATDANDAIANFSSRGPAVWKTGSIVKPEVSAPGVKIKSSIPGGGYAEFSGTSMATPHAAGALALIYQMQPSITVEKLGQLIKQTATKIGNDPNTFGAGRIDILKASQTMLGRPPLR